MKKSIALFSTLMMLVLVSILMTVALRNSTNIKKSSLKDRYLIQENLTVTDLLELINTKIAPKLLAQKGKSRVESQKILFSTPLVIKNSVTKSTIKIKMDSNDGKLNINFINSIDGVKFVKNLFGQIGVKEPQILADIILANITNSDKYSDDYKIPLKQLDRRFGYIRSYEQFKDMLEVYVHNTDDREAFSIKFENYFNFYINPEQTYNRVQSDILDMNYLPLEIIDSVIGLNNSIRKNIQTKKYLFYSFDDLSLDSKSNQKDTLEKYGFGFETHNILLKINITSINNRVKYLFNYNVKSKKISKISMDRWIY